MFQPRAKLEFVRRYLDPAQGWVVHVDIDASEEGRTGGVRRSLAAQTRQVEMIADAKSVRETLTGIGVTVGGARQTWCAQHDLPRVRGDYDILAFSKGLRCLAIAEVEGISSGQPEQKLYKALGQIVMAASASIPVGWKRSLYVVVFGDAIAGHLRRASDALARLEISAVALSGEGRMKDAWAAGAPPAREEGSG